MPFQICRICYKRGYDLMSLEDNASSYLKKLSSCVPEIDVYIIDNPGVCRRCAEMLDTAFELRETCLQNEKRYNVIYSRNPEVINEDLMILHTSNNLGDSYMEHSSNDASTVSTRNLNEQNVHTENISEMEETASESSSACNLCNQNFLSLHDRKMHVHKMHRQLYYKSLKNLLAPLDNHNIKQPQDAAINASDTTTFHINTSSILNSQDPENMSNVIANNLDNREKIRNFQCNKCNLVFINHCEFESHNLTHVTNSCKICGKIVKGDEFDVHMKLHSTKCCGESFASATLLQLHTYKEHNTSCGICDEKFVQFSSLFSHLLEHMSNNWIKCSFCSKQFKSKLELEHHICKYYLCQQCEIIYPTKVTYTNHIQSHDTSFNMTRSTAVKYTCTKCNKSYVTRGKFMKHWHSNNNEQKCITKAAQKNSYSCQLCKRQYQLFVHLKMHMLQVHCSKKIVIPIVDCRKDNFYKEQEGLRINFHIPPQYVGHNSEKYSIIKNLLSNRSKKICFKCRIMFGTRSAFFSHEKQNHGVCCGKKFKYLSMIIKHNFTHYNEEEKDGIYADILCRKCRKTFQNYTSALAHNCPHSFLVSEQNKKVGCTIEMHENDSDVSENTTPDAPTLNNLLCEICKKSFECKSALLQHIKTHI